MLVGVPTLRVEKMISLMVSEGSVSAPACTHMPSLSAGHSISNSVSCLTGQQHAEAQNSCARKQLKAYDDVAAASPDSGQTQAASCQMPAFT